MSLVKIECWNSRTGGPVLLEYPLDEICHGWRKRESTFYKRIDIVGFKLEKINDLAVLSIQFNGRGGWCVCHTEKKEDNIFIDYNDADFPAYRFDEFADSLWMAANMGA